MCGFTIEINHSSNNQLAPGASDRDVEGIIDDIGFTGHKTLGNDGKFQPIGWDPTNPVWNFN